MLMRLVFWFLEMTLNVIGLLSTSTLGHQFNILHETSPLNVYNLNALFKPFTQAL